MATHSLHKLVVVLDVSFEGEQCWADSVFPAEDEALDPPGKYAKDLMLHEGSSWDGKDVVKFL
jgi:hypothetical protein